MLVCHCNAVSDRTIRKAVRTGAITADEVGHACGAGACCGGCQDAIQQIIHSETGSLEQNSSESSRGAAAPSS